MKICITSEGQTLDSNLDVRFGRCAYFIIFDIDTKNWEAVKNDNINLTGGAGIQSAQAVIAKGAKAVVSGKMGENAYKTLKTAGIAIYLSSGGKIEEVLEQYKLNKLEQMI